MRKLKKSQFGPDNPVFLLSSSHKVITTTSTKPHARLMHSLSVLWYGENPKSPYFPRLCDLGQAPTRAERRAHLQPNYTPEQLENMPLEHPANVVPGLRKLTGAVRRGLSRGRVA